MMFARKPWLSTVAIILGVIAGLWFATVRPLLEVFARDKWTPTPCTVVSSRIHLQSYYSSKSETQALVTCHYRFADRAYESEIRMHIESRYESDARAKIAEYPDGSTHSCLVNPAAPNEYVLENPIPRSPFVFAVMFLFSGGLFLFLSWSDYRKKRAKRESEGLLDAIP